MREKYGMAPTEGYGSECEGGGLNPSDDFFRCLAKKFTAPENHQVGTCKMGPQDDPMAVVDMQLKVHGIKGKDPLTIGTYLIFLVWCKFNYSLCLFQVFV